jgi:hypothetical protein
MNFHCYETKTFYLARFFAKEIYDNFLSKINAKNAFTPKPQNKF